MSIPGWSAGRHDGDSEMEPGGADAGDMGVGVEHGEKRGALDQRLAARPRDGDGGALDIDHGRRFQVDPRTLRWGKSRPS